MTTRSGARLVTVAIPDKDPCEDTIRYAAEKMCNGIDVIVVDRHPIIPESVMPALFAKLNEVVRDAAGQVKHHMDDAFIAAHLGTRRNQS